jgi:hypothetical protein
MERPLENQSDIVRACRDWWSVDEELETLTAQYSSVETELIRRARAYEVARSDADGAELLQSLERQLKRLDERRAACREILERLPVRTIGDAAEKLAIAARLLSDEGGFEAAVVDEVAKLLASYDRAA